VLQFGYYPGLSSVMAFRGLNIMSGCRAKLSHRTGRSGCDPGRPPRGFLIATFGHAGLSDVDHQHGYTTARLRHPIAFMLFRVLPAVRNHVGAELTRHQGSGMRSEPSRRLHCGGGKGGVTQREACNAEANRRYAAHARGPSDRR